MISSTQYLGKKRCIRCVEMAKIIHSIFIVSLLLFSMASVCTAQLPGMPERDASSGVVPNAPNDVDTGYSSSAKEHPAKIGRAHV